MTDACYVTDEASLIPVPTTRAYTMKRGFLSRVTCIRTNRFLTVQPVQINLMKVSKIRFHLFRTNGTSSYVPGKINHVKSMHELNYLEQKNNINIILEFIILARIILRYYVITF